MKRILLWTFGLLLAAALIGGCLWVKDTYAPSISNDYHDEGERSVHGTSLSWEEAQSFFDDHQAELSTLPSQLGNDRPQFYVFRGEDGTLLCHFYAGDGQNNELLLEEAGLPQDAVDCLVTLMELPALWIDYWPGEDGCGLRVVTYTSYDRPAGYACAAYNEEGLTYFAGAHDPEDPWSVHLGDLWYYYDEYMP